MTLEKYIYPVTEGVNEMSFIQKLIAHLLTGIKLPFRKLIATNFML
jgi:hypothetical protein